MPRLRCGPWRPLPPQRRALSCDHSPHRTRCSGRLCHKDRLMKVDLSDLLGEPKGSNVVSLDDLIEPRKVREPLEVVCFWTEWNCACGRHYEMPTYGDVLTRVQIYKHGKPHHVQYERYFPACHALLPRRVETKTISIQKCPSCLQEKTLLEHFDDHKK